MVSFFRRSPRYLVEHKPEVPLNPKSSGSKSGPISQTEISNEEQPRNMRPGLQVRRDPNRMQSPLGVREIERYAEKCAVPELQDYRPRPMPEGCSTGNTKYRD